MSESNFEKFKKTWEEQINKLENATLDTRAVHLLYLAFDRGEIGLELSLHSLAFTWDMMLEINLLKSRLIRVLETARTRYIMQRHSIWARIFESLAAIIYGISKSREIKKIPEMPKE